MLLEICMHIAVKSYLQGRDGLHLCGTMYQQRCESHAMRVARQWASCKQYNDRGTLPFIQGRTMVLQCLNRLTIPPLLPPDLVNSQPQQRTLPVFCLKGTNKRISRNICTRRHSKTS